MANTLFLTFYTVKVLLYIQNILYLIICANIFVVYNYKHLLSLLEKEY